MFDQLACNYNEEINDCCSYDCYESSSSHLSFDGTSNVAIIDFSENNLTTNQLTLALKFRATNPNQIAQRLVTTENTNDFYNVMIARAKTTKKELNLILKMIMKFATRA